MNRAVFLDRDGTIIKDRGHINDIKDIVFYNYTFDCLKELQKNFLLFIITNQPGVAKGFIKGESLNIIHSNILHKMIDRGIDIKEIYCCTHRKEDNCSCRKPNTFFIDTAKDKFSIDLENSYIIGDHPSDIELAIRIKANGIYLLTGHGQQHFRELSCQQKKKIRVCSSLKTATQTILKSINQGT
jgi:D-glycero-D-manno-heptose 1,7-bisphosphate phosphatase